MVKSSMPPVTILLAVFALAISLHGVHGGLTSKAPVSILPAAESIKGDQTATEKAIEVAKHLKTIAGAGKAGLKFYLNKKKEGEREHGNAVVTPGHSTRLIPNSDFPLLAYVGVSAIQVGDGEPLQMESMLDFNPENGGHGGVFLSTEYRLTFLYSEAYALLKSEISSGISGAELAASELGAHVNQPCYAGVLADHLQPITFVFADGAKMKVRADKCWYLQSDGSMCLAILPSPWATGETIIGTMMQTSGMAVVGDQLTF